MVDWLVFPFRAVPQLPMFMAVGIGGAALMGFAVFALLWGAYGRGRALAALPLVRRVVVLWAIIAVVGTYLLPFLLVLIIGAPLG